MCATYSVCEQFRGKHLDKCSDECAESGGSIVLYKTENSKAGDIQAHLKKNTVTLEPREAIPDEAALADWPDTVEKVLY